MQLSYGTQGGGTNRPMYRQYGQMCWRIKGITLRCGDAENEFVTAAYKWVAYGLLDRVCVERAKQVESSATGLTIYPTRHAAVKCNRLCSSSQTSFFRLQN
jgi:hypothetical protein